MPSLVTPITPIQQTRSFYLKPADGLRYGNFEGVVHLPPVSGATQLAAHNFTTLNNQQIYKTVCGWFDQWRPWQQKVLLCGIVDRCSVRQVDILATTLEPIKHRDYSVAVRTEYPSTPLKQTRDLPKPKKKKKKKKRKHAVKPKKDPASGTGTGDDTISSDVAQSQSAVGYSTQSMSISGLSPDSPESVYSAIPTFLTDENTFKGEFHDDFMERLMEKKKRRKLERELQEKPVNTLEDFAESLALSILDNALFSPRLGEFARDLASNIIDTAIQSVNTGGDDVEQVDLQNLQHLQTSTPVKRESKTSSDQDKKVMKKHSQKEKLEEAFAKREVSTITEKDEKDSMNLTLKSGSTRPRTQQDPLKSHSGDKGSILVKEKTGLKIDTSKSAKDSEEPLVKVSRPQSVVRIVTPDGMSERKESAKHSDQHSDGTRSLSLPGRTNINKMRRSLFGSSVVSTPDFFDKDGLTKFGTMQREIRQGLVHRPARVQDIPVPASRLYKSVKWWTDEPHEGKIFLKAKKKDLNNNFRDQQQQVWDWMSMWEDYEKIALLKELVKLCVPEHLSFLASHIEQQLRDARDINRLSDKLLLYIFSYLPTDKISVASRVCRRWRFLCATDDLWRVKCHELGVDEGIENLEELVLKANRHKMGIDWRLAYEELRRITYMMKLGFSMAQKAEADRRARAAMQDTKKIEDQETGVKVMIRLKDEESISESESESVSDSDLSSESEADNNEPQGRFAFANQVNYEKRESYADVELQNLLRKILFSPEGPVQRVDSASTTGEPKIVELPVRRGTESAIERERTRGHEIKDTDSVLSEDLDAFDEYKIKPAKISDEESRSRRYQSHLRNSMTRSETDIKLEEVTEEEKPEESLKRVKTQVLPSVVRRKGKPEEDDDEEAAYDIRPELIQARDILGKTVPKLTLKWRKEEPSKAEADTVRSQDVIGTVKSVVRARKLQGHMNGILCVQFDKRRLISAGLDRVIRIWDIRSGRSIHKFFGHKGGIRCLYFRDNELVTGSWDTTIMVWDLKHLVRKAVLNDHMGLVSCIQMDDTYIVSGSHDMTVRVWHRRTLMCMRVIKGHHGLITCLAFDGHNVVSGSTDMTLRLNNIKTGQCLHVFSGCNDHVSTLTMHGSLIISGDPQGHVYFWNKRTGECEAAVAAHDDSINRLTYMNGRFFTASGDGTIREWDLTTMTSVRLLQGHKGPVRDVKVSDQRIVSCSDDGSIRIWDLFDPRQKITHDTTHTLVQTRVQSPVPVVQA